MVKLSPSKDKSKKGNIYVNKNKTETNTNGISEKTENNILESSIESFIHSERMKTNGTAELLNNNRILNVDSCKKQKNKIKHFEEIQTSDPIRNISSEESLSVTPSSKKSKKSLCIESQLNEELNESLASDIHIVSSENSIESFIYCERMKSNGTAELLNNNRLLNGDSCKKQKKKMKHSEEVQTSDPISNISSEKSLSVTPSGKKNKKSLCIQSQLNEEPNESLVSDNIHNASGKMSKKKSKTSSLCNESVTGSDISSQSNSSELSTPIVNKSFTSNNGGVKKSKKKCRKSTLCNKAVNVSELLYPSVQNNFMEIQDTTDNTQKKGKNIKSFENEIINECVQETPISIKKEKKKNRKKFQQSITNEESEQTLVLNDSNINDATGKIAKDEASLNGYDISEEFINNVSPETNDKCTDILKKKQKAENDISSEETEFLPRDPNRKQKRKSKSITDQNELNETIDITPTKIQCKDVCSRKSKKKAKKLENEDEQTKSFGEIVQKEKHIEKKRKVRESSFLADEENTDELPVFHYLVQDNKNLDENSETPSKKIKMSSKVSASKTSNDESMQHENSSYDCAFDKEFPLKSKGRKFSVSIAIPVSILEQSPLQELQTLIIGQIARSACIFSVDEIVIYDDHCWKNTQSEEDIKHAFGMMRMILEYQECPQYIRRDFFPFHPYTKHVGILNPLNAPHHLRKNEWCEYREGISLRGHGKRTEVNIGLGRPADVNCNIEEGVRVTVKLSPESKYLNRMVGTAVAPHEPRTKGGIYWGYTVREASSLSEVITGNYDLIIGTSDKGSDAAKLNVHSFKKALIVFGGMEGLEAALNKNSGILDKDPKKYFQHYVNTCVNQTSRTIRTEEAILISLSVLHSKLFKL